MDNHRYQERAFRSAQLHAIARGFVTEGLGKRNFEAIPYSKDVVGYAPLVPGHSTASIVGREALRREWWAPLPGVLKAVDVLNTFVSQDLSLVVVEFYCVLHKPCCTLRVVDCLNVNAEGEIVKHEHFVVPHHVPGLGVPRW